MMTEDEAKTKWCPAVRLVPETDLQFSATNRGDKLGQEPGTTFNCIGSACMAWRWQPLLADDAFVAAVVKAAKEIGDSSPSHTKAVKHVRENRAEYGLPTKPFLGFCGLASKPDA